MEIYLGLIKEKKPERSQHYMTRERSEFDLSHPKPYSDTGIEFKTTGSITDQFRGIYRIYLGLIKENTPNDHDIT